MQLQNRVSLTIELSKLFTFGHPMVLQGGFSDVVDTCWWGPHVSLFFISLLFLSFFPSLSSLPASPPPRLPRLPPGSSARRAARSLRAGSRGQGPLGRAQGPPACRTAARDRRRVGRRREESGSIRHAAPPGTASRGLEEREREETERWERREENELTCGPTAMCQPHHQTTQQNHRMAKCERFW